MKKTFKAVVRICAVLLLMSIGFCGCNTVEVPTATLAPTEAPTEKPSETRATKKPTETQAPTERQTADPTAPKKRIAMTFDDGPDDENTKKLVDVLDSYGFNATFFVIGQKVDGSRFNGGEMLKYAVEKGNEIGIHAYTHKTPYDDTCSDETFEEEIGKTRDAILEVLPDYDIKLMRPTQGKITDARVAACPYSVILWNLDTLDWKYTARGTEKTKSQNITTIVNSVLSRVKEGDIVLMHEIHDNSYEAALIILEELYLDGYEVVTVSELLGDKAEAGKRFYKAN